VAKARLRAEKSTSVGSLRLGRLISSIFTWILGTFVTLVALIFFGSMIVLGTTNPVTPILGHSMNPLLFEGDLAIIKSVESDSVSTGDVIRFRVTEDNQKKLGLPDTILHRVVSIRSSPSGLMFTTKGDNNPLQDTFETRADNVTGVYQGVIPKLGFAIFFIQAPSAPWLLLVLALLTIAYLTIGWFESRMKATKSREELLEGFLNELPKLQNQINELTSQLRDQQPPVKKPTPEKPAPVDPTQKP